MAHARYLLALVALMLAPAAAAETGRMCVTPYGWCALGDAASADCTCVRGDETVSGVAADGAARNPLTELDAPVATRNIGLATRAFAGPSQFPPSAYRAYGMVVFKTRASRFDRDRHVEACEAYVSALAQTTEADVPRDQQMVTVWPVSRDAVADEINPLHGAAACEPAIDNYGLVQAHNALRILQGYGHAGGGYDTGGRGPFLVAWTPGGHIAEPESIALLVDLSQVEGGAALVDAMALWRDRIQSDPELWRAEDVRPGLIERLRRFFDENGVLLEAMGAL